MEELLAGSMVTLTIGTPIVCYIYGAKQVRLVKEQETIYRRVAGFIIVNALLTFALLLLMLSGEWVELALTLTAIVVALEVWLCDICLKRQMFWVRWVMCCVVIAAFVGISVLAGAGIYSVLLAVSAIGIMATLPLLRRFRAW